MSRGLRNNNPGNIRINGEIWRGEVTPSRDPSFKQFASMAWGYRAMFLILDNYRKRYGARTLRDVITRYAPPVENETGTYVSFVAAQAGVGEDEPLPFGDAARMRAVVAAMSRIENGVAAIAADVAAGWELFEKHRK